MAELAVLDKDWAGADTAFRLALNRLGSSPDQIDLFLRWANTLQQARWYDQSVLLYERVIQLAPSATSEPYTAIGHIKDLQKNYQEAADWFARAIMLFPRDPWPHIRAGELAAERGDPAEARRQFDMALQSSPEHFGALLFFGIFEYQHDNPTAAAYYLERANRPTANCFASDLLLRIYPLIGENGKAAELQSRLEKGCTP
jgi:tetratricopeptide (TPR) repeat protein